jgi:serine phosphatase RsbU (regulator of sigma subunit)
VDGNRLSDGAAQRGEQAVGVHREWRRQVVGLGVLGALLTVVVAATAVFAVAGTVRTGHQVGQLTRAQRLHQDVDMMHDALRADVMSARQTVRGPEPVAPARGWTATAKDADRLLRDVDTLRGLDLPEPVAAALASLRDDQTAYVDLALRLGDGARKGRQPTLAQLRDFQGRFERLLAPQAAVTATLTATSSRVVRAQTRHERVIAMVLMAAAGMALGGWTLLLALHRRARRSLDDALGREAEQRAVADQLQQSLLPDRLPSVPGLRLAARSQPGDPSHQVGGDWYDVLTLPSGKVGLVVGDVVGHDVAAAAAMGQIRAALRSVAAFESSPGAVLDRVNEIAEMYDVTELTTCLYAVVDPGTRVVIWASAGHLNPLLVLDAGASQLLDGDPGPPLGVSGTAVYTDRSCRVPPGGSLLLYTDGLVERSSRPIDDGLALLESVRGPHRDPEQLCEQVLTLLAGEPATYDDVTLLALRADDTVDQRVPV